MHKKRLWTQFIGWSRTIHIYLTMMGLLAMVLFGATGYTINHEDWFGATHPVVVEFQGEIPREPITKGDRLAVVEKLRANYRITGAVTAYDDFDDELSIAFKEPGQIWEIRVAKATAKVDGQKITDVAGMIDVQLSDVARGKVDGKLDVEKQSFSGTGSVSQIKPWQSGPVTGRPDTRRGMESTGSERRVSAASWPHPSAEARRLQRRTEKNRGRGRLALPRGRVTRLPVGETN